LHPAIFGAEFSAGRQVFLPNSFLAAGLGEICGAIILIFFWSTAWHHCGSAWIIEDYPEQYATAPLFGRSFFYLPQRISRELSPQENVNKSIIRYFEGVFCK
jgi:hypothetical protein